jgi:hypothetical protein
MARDVVAQRFLKKFGLRIRGLRQDKGWTLEETEEHGWPNWVHMQRIESGKKNINLSTVVRLSRLYRISLSELFKDL